jgi:hypothetical protein
MVYVFAHIYSGEANVFSRRKVSRKGKEFRALSFDMSFDIKVSKFPRPVYWCICVVVLLHTRPHTDTCVLKPVRTSPDSYTYVSAMKVPYMCVLILLLYVFTGNLPTPEPTRSIKNKSTWRKNILIGNLICDTFTAKNNNALLFNQLLIKGVAYQ